MSPVSEHVPEFGDKHVTHVEVDSAGYYFWCEADDCYATGGRHETMRSAADAAAHHEAWPG